MIVVFGAAEYAGRPSPVFRARLDHALALYQKGYAPLIITTGGSGLNSQFNEGTVGHDYLISRGLDDTVVIAETQSDSTVESARRVATIMRTNGLRDCLAVSDGYHMFRIKHMLAREGVKSYASPRPVTKASSWQQRLDEVSHELLSYTIWSLHLT